MIHIDLISLNKALEEVTNVACPKIIRYCYLFPFVKNMIVYDENNMYIYIYI